MDIYQIRRARLRQIATQLGGQAGLANRAELDESLVSKLIGRNASRVIGNRLAARIESRLHMPSGSLDDLAPLLDLACPLSVEKLVTLPPGTRALVLQLIQQPLDEAAAQALLTLLSRL